MNSTCYALKKVDRPKQTFFGQTSIEKQPAICSEHFTVGLFAMTFDSAKCCLNFLFIFLTPKIAYKKMPKFGENK